MDLSPPFKPPRFQRVVLSYLHRVCTTQHVDILFGPKGDASGPVRRRRGARALVERVKQLLFFCSGYAVVAVSCYIVLVR